MQKKVIYLTMVILILSGCNHRGFQPKNSTCDKVQQDLSLMEISGGSSAKYSTSDIHRLKVIVDDCRVANSLSQKDYIKYKELLNEISELNSEADDILNTNIHDQRIK